MKRDKKKLMSFLYFYFHNFQWY